MDGHPLPVGWTAHQDPSTGSFYFVSAATGETTWTRPTPPPPPVQPAKPSLLLARLLKKETSPVTSPFVESAGGDKDESGSSFELASIPHEDGTAAPDFLAAGNRSMEMPSLASSRAEQERIQMHDCRNMLSLVDLQRRGRLQAEMAALQAGYFGGGGVLAQRMFKASGVVLFGMSVGYLFLQVIGVIKAGTLKSTIHNMLQSGFWLLIPVSMAVFGRGYFLEKLEAHQARRGEPRRRPTINSSEAAWDTARRRTGSVTSKAARDAVDVLGALERGGDVGIDDLAQTNQEDLTHMMQEERLGESLRFCLNVAIMGTTTSISWVLLWYSTEEETWYLLPVLPPQDRTFKIMLVFATLAFNAVWVPLVWLFVKGHMKRAQQHMYRVLGVIVLNCSAAFFVGKEDPNSHGWIRHLPKIILGLIIASMLLIGALMRYILRNHRKNAMTKELKEDMNNYVDAWKHLFRGGSGNTHRNELKSIEALAQDAANSRPRTRTLSFRTSFTDEKDRSPRDGVNLKGRETRDQLLIMMTQAWAVNDKFQKLSKEWRAQVVSPGTGGEERESILPKRRARAIEKVWRAYDGDATRLRDLVRCSLVFDQISDVKRCLEAILRDDRVVVQQIKNRLALSYNACEKSCGYRDIQLKITLGEGQFDNAELDMGLHEHVCEVQLHLKSMYDLKSDSGHQRYVNYRNKIAE